LKSPFSKLSRRTPEQEACPVFSSESAREYTRLQARASKEFLGRKKLHAISGGSAGFTGSRRRHANCHSTRRVAGFSQTRQVRELGELGRRRMQGHHIPFVVPLRFHPSTAFLHME
jgi:hypothetical protein